MAETLPFDRYRPKTKLNAKLVFNHPVVELLRARYEYVIWNKKGTDFNFLVGWNWLSSGESFPKGLGICTAVKYYLGEEISWQNDSDTVLLRKVMTALAAYNQDPTGTRKHVEPLWLTTPETRQDLLHQVFIEYAQLSARAPQSEEFTEAINNELLSWCGLHIYP